MANFKLPNYEETDGCYTKDRVPITNFLLEVKKIIMVDSNTILFYFEVDIGGRKHSITVPYNKIHRTRFLQELPVIITDEEEFYRQLRNELLVRDYEEDEILFQINKNGL